MSGAKAQGGILFAACLFAAKQNWLALIPYASSALGSGHWSLTASLFARGLLPLLFVVGFRCKPLSKRTVCLVSTILIVAAFLLTIPLLYFDLEENSLVAAGLMAVGSVSIGWFYNQIGGLVAVMNLRTAAVSIFLGTGITALCVLLTTFFDVNIMAITVLSSLAVTLAMVFVYPWDAIKADDEAKFETNEKGIFFLSDIARASLPLILFCLAWGAMNFVPYEIDSMLYIDTNKITWLFTAAVCLVTCLLLMKRTTVPLIAKIFKVTIVLSSLGLALELFPDPALSNIGRIFFSGMSDIVPAVWFVMTSLLARKSRLPSWVVFAISTPVLLISLALGQTMGLLLSFTSFYEPLFTACCLLLLILSALTVSQMEQWLVPFTKKKKAEQEKPEKRALNKVLEILKADFGLSNRELEIIEFLRRGRTYEYCATELQISVNTTRTHIKRMYGKLNINSREELLDLIDSLEAPLG